MECLYCARKCNIGKGETGYCGMYMSDGKEIVEVYPNKYSSYNATHIEQLPFYHAYPGSRTLMVGTTGCNLNCDYCINSYVAKADPEEVYLFDLEPEKVVETAVDSGCHNIVFSINEVLVAIPTIIKVAKEASKKGLPMGCLTNGYMTKEVLEIICENFSFINVSLKSMSDNFYKRYTGVESVQPVLDSIKALGKRVHLEVATPIVQGINDTEIMEMSEFIASINDEIPWHVYRTLPHYKMEDEEYPDIGEINSRLDNARNNLKHIYFSNFVGSEWVTTICPKCNSEVIERLTLGACGGKLLEYHLDGNKCTKCGYSLNILGEYIPWGKGQEVAAV